MSAAELGVVSPDTAQPRQVELTSTSQLWPCTKQLAIAAASSDVHTLLWSACGGIHLLAGGVTDRGGQLPPPSPGGGTDAASGPAPVAGALHAAAATAAHSEATAARATRWIMVEDSTIGAPPTAGDNLDGGPRRSAL
jgi:hypothetical protein